ncbi:PREDICTED: tetraspanin-2 [Thamnophis sirtalis]|uniref:Tetraspanin n=1 Tax=Thamnophis sirtalis TaxID=35019 RepID=A0A6I9XEQ3_9SAUR|nr:PREDICTED: tetraspanin-2 [Thamnophis sirtalis]XP_032074235.1 tetraspanin-2 [Thamnophis elegans]
MGRVQGGMRCVKFLLFLFNFIFWLAGSAVIAFGLWLRFGNVIRDLATDEASPEYFYMGLYVLIGAGVLMMAVGFFGCCGAARESQCLLGAFFTCLLVIFAAEIAAGVFAFLGKKTAVNEVQAIYEKAYENYINDQSKNKTLIKFHDALQCCGKDSDVQVKPTCPKDIGSSKNCLTEIETLLNSNLHLLGIVGIAIAGITIFGMIFSMVLCCAIRNTRDML